MDLDALWKKIQQNDEHSFKILFEEFYSGLFRYALQMLKDSFLAEETVLDVFLKVWHIRTIELQARKNRN